MNDHRATAGTEPDATLDQVIIFGAGGHGRVCAETAMAAGFSVAAFCDKAGGAAINGIDVLKAASVSGLTNTFDTSGYGIFVAIGDNDIRLQLLAEAEALGFCLPSIIHPSAVVSPSAEIGAGTAVIANSVVNANARIGKGCILNTACSIDHDNILEDGVQICPGVRSAGNVTFGQKSFIGTGTVIVPGVKIGRNARISAGAVITTDVPDGARAPARKM